MKGSVGKILGMKEAQSDNFRKKCHYFLICTIISYFVNLVKLLMFITAQWPLNSNLTGAYRTGSFSNSHSYLKKEKNTINQVV